MFSSVGHGSAFELRKDLADPSAVVRTLRLVGNAAHPTAESSGRCRMTFTVRVDSLGISFPCERAGIRAGLRGARLFDRLVLHKRLQILAKSAPRSGS